VGGGLGHVAAVALEVQGGMMLFPLGQGRPRHEHVVYRPSAGRPMDNGGIWCGWTSSTTRSA
jgi:hypothetical protein